MKWALSLLALIVIAASSGCWRPYYGQTYAAPVMPQAPAYQPQVIAGPAPTYQAPVYQAPAMQACPPATQQVCPPGYVPAVQQTQQVCPPGYAPANVCPPGTYPSY